MDDNGRSIGAAIDVTLAPGQVHRSIMAEFLSSVITISPQPLISGYVRIRSLQGESFQIVGDVEISVANRGATRAATMVYPIRDAAAQSWTVPFAASAGQYFTGYAVANPNELLAVQTDVQIDVVGPEGNVLSTRSISLSPRFRESALIPPGVPNGVSALYVESADSRDERHRHRRRTCSGLLTRASKLNLARVPARSTWIRRAGLQ